MASTWPTTNQLVIGDQWTIDVPVKQRPKLPRPPRRHEQGRHAWRAKRERARRAAVFATLKLCPECSQSSVRTVHGTWGPWQLDERYCTNGHYWAFDRRAMQRVVGLGYRMDRRTGTPLPVAGMATVAHTGQWWFPKWDGSANDQDVPF